MNIIGIAGRRTDLSSAGAGKDEVAKILAKNHGFAIVSFADEIKRTAMRWYDFDPAQLWGSRKEEPDLRYPRDHGPWKLIPNTETDAVCACCGVRAKQEIWMQDGIPRFAPRPEGLPQCYLTPRWVCRFLGTEAGRMFWFDTWVSLTIRIAKKLLEEENSYGCRWEYDPTRGAVITYTAVHAPHAGVVIPDVRWPAANEGEVIKKAGGQLWLVERPGTAQQGTAIAKHDSETQPIPDEVFDKIIKNNRIASRPRICCHGCGEPVMMPKRKHTTEPCPTCGSISPRAMQMGSNTCTNSRTCNERRCRRRKQEDDERVANELHVQCRATHKQSAVKLCLLSIGHTGLHLNGTVEWAGDK